MSDDKLESGKTAVYKNGTIYFEVGTGLTPREGFIKVQAPEQIENYSIQDCLDYVLGETYSGSQRELQNNVLRMMKAKRFGARRNWRVTMNNVDVNPNTRLDEYITRSDSTEVAEDTSLVFKVSEQSGGGKYLK